MKRLFFFGFILLSMSSHAQSSKKIDSLKKALVTASDTMRVNIQYNVARLYQMSNPDSAMHYSQLAQKGGAENDMFFTRYHAIQIMTSIYQSQGKYEKSFETNNMARQLAIEFDNGFNIGNTYMKSGISNTWLKNYDKAISDFLTADSLYASVGHKFNRSNAIGGLGLVYQELGQYETSYDYYLKAFDIAEENGKRISIISACYSMVLITKLTGRSKEYQKYLTKYYEVLGENRSRSKPVSLNHMTTLLIGENNTKEKAEALKESLAYHREMNFPFGITVSSAMLGDVYRGQENYIESNRYFNIALSTVDSLNYYSMHSDILDKLYKNKVTESRWEEAVNYLEQSQKLDAEATSQEQNKIVEDLRIKYETAQKEAQLEKKTAQGNMYKAGMGLVGMLLLSSLLFFRQRSKNQRIMSDKNAEIQKQKIIELEQQNKLFALDAMITGQEKERQRIAQDLHDGLGGLLTTVKLQFESVQKEMDKLSELNVYKRANELLDDACSEVRKIAHNMMPGSLTKLGLDGAIKELVESQNQSTETSYQYYGLTNLSHFNDTDKVMVYRIVQELLQNTYKHANAKQVIVQFSREGDNCILTVEDDGIGFDTKLKKDGLGIQGINSRVSFLNGEIEIDSEIGKGSTTTVKIPVT